MPEVPEYHKDQIGSKCSRPLISDYVITSYFVQTISIYWVGNFLLPRYHNGGYCMECRGGGALYLVLFQRISVNLSGPKENVFENPMRVRDDKISDVRMMTRMT